LWERLEGEISLHIVFNASALRKWLAPQALASNEEIPRLRIVA
jgi:hypothetical protein